MSLTDVTGYPEGFPHCGVDPANGEIGDTADIVERQRFLLPLLLSDQIWIGRCLSDRTLPRPSDRKEGEETLGVSLSPSRSSLLITHFRFPLISMFPSLGLPVALLMIKWAISYSLGVFTLT